MTPIHENVQEVSARTERPNVLQIVLTIGVVLLFCASAFLIWELWPSNPPVRAERLPEAPINVSGAHTLGSSDARVVIVEFADFQCPYCSSFDRTTLPALISRYIDNGKVQIVFRHFPLDSIHPLARRASIASDCASSQGEGLFWPMHDAIIKRLAEGARVDFEELATGVGSEPSAFRRCFEAADDPTLQADISAGEALDVAGTPTFFVGRRLPTGLIDVRRRISGAKPLEEFVSSIDELLGAPSHD